MNILKLTLLIIAAICLPLGLAAIGRSHAGTCRIYSEGTSTVEACENGSYTVTDKNGHRRVYGEPNAGFERYPGQGNRPVYERKDWR
jgi:hypothetical protein